MSAAEPFEVIMIDRGHGLCVTSESVKYSCAGSAAEMVGKWLSGSFCNMHNLKYAHPCLPIFESQNIIFGDRL